MGDIPALFRLVDKDGDGELDIVEFRALMRKMRIGLSDTRIVELFQSFDYDFGGTISHTEFIRILFPGSYHEILKADSCQETTTMDNAVPHSETEVTSTGSNCN